MNVKYLGVLGLIFVTSCAAVAIPTSSTKTIYDVVFEVNGCSISADRKAVCSLYVTSKYRDRIVAIGNGASLQDSTGENYPASVRFGKGTWSKTLIADSPYELNFTVENVSTKATSVRAIIINTIGVNLGPKQHVGAQHQVIFSNPKMLQKENNNTSNSTAQVAPKAEVSPQATKNVDIWTTVGYWDYDGADGSYIPEGMLLVNEAGGNMGKQWKSRIELKAHERLSNRNRTLWPVQMNVAQRKICVNAPGYPTYSAYIDLDGSENDGTYVFQSCSGGE